MRIDHLEARRESGSELGGRTWRARNAVSDVELPGLEELAQPTEYLARHSRSFRFAASMMARSDRARVARVYAWCRYTDNLVDDDVSAELATRRLEAWLDRSRQAYDGGDSGVPLVNHVMWEMAEREIPFSYARDLVQAMRSDVEFSPYPDLDALRVYTDRAAGVVGRWLTELHGVRDRWMLERATSLGCAMQLTNILRDVGEDLTRGRMYLPMSELRRHRLTAADIHAMHRGARPVDAAYRAVTEELMAVAQADYDRANEALPLLPRSFRRAAAVASAVYQGIHDAIRRNGYDNFRMRAYTTGSRKAALALSAIVSFGRARAVTSAPV